MPEFNKLKNCVRFPTSIIVRGEDLLGIELAKSLLEQGGFVILIDNGFANVDKYLPLIDGYDENLLILDFSGLLTLTQELRRLDYVFYLDHQIADFSQKISTQEFLQASNYLDAVLDLTAKFDAKFLLTTSIKAHQLIIADKIIDLNYNVDAEDRYAVYSELEIQRYAESLVKEYQTKVGVNARVVRLGTLLGKGMEINLESDLIRMILQGLQSKNFTVPGDGLDTDYYIHYLDAAYGIIKAQFTPNTKGRIFTLCNEEEVTVLSIAYKLMELISSAREIRFDSEDHNLPPIKLYKPAPNLMEIGWKPRVPFERALKQTVDYLSVRIHEAGGDLNNLNNDLIPINPVRIKEEKTFKQKLLDFFFIAESEAETSMAEVNAKAQATADLNTEGALARLIAERRNQERARRGNIILANNQLRSAIQPKPKKNILQRFDDNVARALWLIKKRFDVLRNMSVADFVFFVIGIILFLIIYVVAIVPVFSFGKHIYLAYNNLEALNIAFNTNDAKAIDRNSRELGVNLREAQKRIQEEEFVFNLTGKQKTYQLWQQFLSNSAQFADNLDNVYTDLEPWNSYLAGLNPGFIERLDGATYVSVGGDADYSEQINAIFAKRSDLSISLTSLAKLAPDIKNGLDALPFATGARVSPLIENINSKLTSLSSLKNIYELAPVIFGRDGTRHYLLVIQDNTRYTAGGGELVGYVLFTVQNGNVKSVKVENFSKLSGSVNFDQTAMLNLALSSTNTITPATAKITDAALIPDRDVMLSNIQSFVAGSEHVTIDLTATLNTDVIASILADQDLLYQQERFSPQDFYNSLNSIINSNPSGINKNDTILGIFSKLLEIYGNDLNTNAGLISTVISEGLSGNNIFVHSDNLTFSKYLNALKAEEKANDHILVAANYDQKAVLLSRKPVVTLSGTITIKNDGNSIKSINLSGSSFNSLQNFVLCSPHGSINYSYSLFSNTLVSQAFYSQVDQSCLILLPTSDLKYGITYSNLPYTIKVDGNAPYKLELISSPGIETQYDLEFVFENGVDSYNPVTAGFIKQSTGYLYRGSLNGSKLFIFNSN